MLVSCKRHSRCLNMQLFPHLMQLFFYNLPHKLVEIEYIPVTVSTRCVLTHITLCPYLRLVTKRLQISLLWMTRFCLYYYLHENLLFYIPVLFCALHHVITLAHTLKRWIKIKTVFTLRKFNQFFLKNVNTQVISFFILIFLIFNIKNFSTSRPFKLVNATKVQKYVSIMITI